MFSLTFLRSFFTVDLISYPELTLKVPNRYANALVIAN